MTTLVFLKHKRCLAELHSRRALGRARRLAAERLAVTTVAAGEPGARTTTVVGEAVPRRSRRRVADRATPVHVGDVELEVVDGHRTDPDPMPPCGPVVR